MATKRYSSLELKVGITAAVAMLLLALIIFTVGRFHFGHSGYPIDISFQFVDAINPQADVFIGGGVKIGRVNSIHVIGERIHLRVVINNNVRIPVDAKFQILSKGLMGDKYLNVVPQATVAQDYLKPGAQVEGVEPTNIDKAFTRLGQVADSIRLLVGDPTMKSSLVEMLKNFSSLSRSLDRLATHNEARINAAISDTAASAQSIRDFSHNLNTISQGLTAVLSEDNQENLSVSLKNLKEATLAVDSTLKQINAGQGPLGVLLNDKQVAQDLKAVVKDVKDNPWKLLWKQ